MMNALEIKTGSMSGRVAALVLPVALGLAGCGDGTGPEDAAEVAVRFTATSSARASAQPGLALPQQTGGQLTVQGTNGVLTITDIRMIVNEFELERTDEACPDDDLGGDLDDDDCEKFEAPPTFVDVPLNGGSVVAVTEVVPAGTYVEMEFEVEDLEDDEEDPQERLLIQQLLTQIRSEFPAWPRQASLMVEGTFTPTGGEARAFRAFFEAEIEVERDLVPPLQIDGEADPAITVELDVAAWFRTPTGAVIDLSQFDFDRTGQVPEFEVEIERGFEIEWED